MGKTPITKLAQVAVKYAVDNGKLVKPDNCEKCGKAPTYLHGLHAHHKDYNKPLKVVWLCPGCHRTEHGRITASKLPTGNQKPPTGNRFQRMRTKLFATQQEAATALGVSQQAVSFWEQGSRPVPDFVWIILDYVEREREEV